MNYYKRHIGDYMKDAGHLSLLEHGIYMRLLDVYYTREESIQEDQAARLIGARSRDEKAALQSVLDEFFTYADGRYWNKRCEEEIAKMQAKAETNREVGKRGGRPKKETQQEPTENPNGFQTETQTVSKNNPSHKPLLKPVVLDTLPQDSTIPGACSPPGRIAADLIRLGVKVTAQHPTLLAWCADGIGIARLLQAVDVARLHKPAPQPIPAKYLDTIVRSPPQPRITGGNSAEESRRQFAAGIWGTQDHGDSHANIIDITPAVASEGDRPALSAT